MGQGGPGGIHPTGDDHVHDANHDYIDGHEFHNHDASDDDQPGAVLGNPQLVPRCTTQAGTSLRLGFGTYAQAGVSIRDRSR